MPVLTSGQVSTVLLDASLIAVLIGVIFFTYGSWIVKQTVIRQGKFLASELVPTMSSLNVNLPPANVPADAKQDAARKQNNRKIGWRAFLVLTSILLFGIASSYAVTRYFDRPYWPVARDAMQVSVIVFFFEVVFLTLANQWYLTADPNYVKHRALIDVLLAEPQ